MRVAFVGAGNLSVMTARKLLEYGVEVIIIEENKERIDEMSDQLDCGFLHGDGSKPAVLRQVDPEHTDVLFCITGNDQINIIASLVGRSQGFRRVVTKVEDPELELICAELGLEHTIVPTRTISRFLTDMVWGRDILELSTMIKDAARFFSFVVSDKDEGIVSELELPESARAVCYYREGKFMLADADSKLRKGDEVVVLTHSKNLTKLKERWAPKVENAEEKDS